MADLIVTGASGQTLLDALHTVSHDDRILIETAIIPGRYVLDAGAGVSSGNTIKNFPTGVTIKNKDKNAWPVIDAQYTQGNCFRLINTEGCEIRGLQMIGSTGTCVSYDFNGSGNKLINNYFFETGNATGSGHSSVGGFSPGVLVQGNIILDPAEHDIYLGADDGKVLDNICRAKRAGAGFNGRVGIRLYGSRSNIDNNSIVASNESCIAFSDQLATGNEDIVIQRNRGLLPANYAGIGLDDNNAGGAEHYMVDAVILFNLLCKNTGGGANWPAHIYSLHHASNHDFDVPTAALIGAGGNDFLGTATGYSA